MKSKSVLALVLTLTAFNSLSNSASAQEPKGPHRQILAMAGYTDSEKPKVISFHADWCPTCDQLQPSIDKAQGRYGSQVDFISVNIDDEKNKDIVRLYRVRGVPEVVFVNSRGKVVSTFMGNEPKQLKIGMQKLLDDKSSQTTAIAKGSGVTQ
ncbi:MAG: thioredoxin fold domain-containing protein [Candidatus Obscuribacterales bacterium]|nr:thioredoxin fold domain-containing protein [Candidatus Obscuribacterales bacterium]